MSAREAQRPGSTARPSPRRGALRPLRIAFHAINGVGLGHLARAVALACEVRAITAGAARIVVLTNAHDTSMLARAGLDFVQFPPRLLEPHADPTRARRALLPEVEEAAMVGALEAFAPDVVVFDTHAPMGVVRALPAIGSRAVLVLRELRGESIAALAASGALAWFDRVVVPQVEGEVDVSALAGAAVEVTGHVVRPLSAAARRARPRPATRPLVVAIAGGGGQPVDARRYARAVVDAHILARARIANLETVFVTGPYGDAELGPKAAGLRVVAAVADLPGLLARATLVVSQAGYNAIAELRALRKPAVLVPGARKSEDQRARAARLVVAKAATLARADGRSIADRVEALLTRDGALAAMARAHDASPIEPKNREAALAVLRPVSLHTRTVRRVVLVAHELAPKVGGMETVAGALARGLVERGVTTRVYTTKRLGAAIASGLGEGVVHPLFTPLSPPQRIDLWADLLATVHAAIADAPDVIHLCNAGLAPWVPFLRAALPCAVTIHVHGNDLIAPWVRHGLEPEAYRAAQAAGLAAADAVLAVSRFSAALAERACAEQVSPSVGSSTLTRRGTSCQDLAAFGGSNLAQPVLLAIAPNGVDAERFTPGPRDEALAARLGIDAADEVLLTVSRLAPRKGHAAVLRALAELAPTRPRLKFVYTGANAALGDELARAAASLGVADRVVAAGFVDDAELPALYRLADVFVLVPDGNEARDVEGFGVALLEAAATGVPAIAACTCGVPEAVEDGVSGVLVAKGDGPALAHAIRGLLDDPDAAAELGRTARARAVASFSERAATTRALDVWTSTLAHARRTEPLAAPFRAEIHGVLREASTGAELARLAAREAAHHERERAARREMFRSEALRGRIVRLRATGPGARLLHDALADCAIAGQPPRVEVKLRRFLEHDFLTYAMPRIESVELVHPVPHAWAARTLDALNALPATTLARVRAVRLFLGDEAQRDAALAVSSVPEAHALRALFRAHGALVVPPPELMRYLSDTPAGGPETAMIEPTNLCNLACPTCPTGTGKIKPLPAMTLARFDDVLAELAPRMRNLALWNYGEPLLNRELPAMIEHAKAAGVGVVKVSSNVHFLDETRGRALLRSGLDVLILSVDGASQATYGTFRKDGDFAKVAEQVAWLCAEKRALGLTRPRIELQFIVMRHNEHELDEMRRLARAWGVDRLRIKTVGADDGATRDLVPTSRLYSRYQADGETPSVRHPFCTMAWDHTVVNVDGSVTPCCYLRPDMGDAFVMGNVFDAPFATIWRGERYRAFRAAMLEDRRKMPVCDRCRGGTHDLIAAVEEVA